MFKLGDRVRIASKDKMNIPDRYKYVDKIAIIVKEIKRGNKPFYALSFIENKYNSIGHEHEFNGKLYKTNMWGWWEHQLLLCNKNKRIMEG